MSRSLCGYAHDNEDTAEDCDDCALERRRDEQADGFIEDARDAAAFD